MFESIYNPDTNIIDEIHSLGVAVFSTAKGKCVLNDLIILAQLLSLKGLITSQLTAKAFLA